MPTPEQDGWLIEVMAETTEASRASASSGDWSVSRESVWFSERALESTGQ